MGTWNNDDGLYIKYGTDEATVTQGGTYPTMVAGQHVTEVRIADMTTLGTSAAILADTTVIPAGAIISKVEVIAETACTGTSAALNVGLIRLDRSTELDYDGLVAALALTSIDAVGDVVELVQGSTGHGALVGTELAYAGLLTADYDTAAFTAGEIRVKVYWYKD